MLDFCTKLFVMQKFTIFLFTALFFSYGLKAQKTYEFDFRHNDPNDVSNTLILLETGLDGSMGSMGFNADFNIGAIARYSLDNKIDLQAKIRKAYANLYFDSDYRKNFEFEAVGALFLTDKTKMKKEKVLISGKTEKSGAYVYTESEFFMTDLPQRNQFGFNAGINFKTFGINPREGGYKGSIKNVNFSSVSIVGGLQFKRLNASVVQVKKPRLNRIFDDYVVMTIDAILAPINTFRDVETGSFIGNELKENGLENLFPIGGRFTYNIYGSIPTDKGSKGFRYTFSSSLGVRPYLGFHFDLGIGFMLYRS
jgi:hypothetical protein